MVGVVISLTMLLKILSSKRCRSDADDNLSDAPKKAQMVIFLMMLLKILISKKMMMILILMMLLKILNCGKAIQDSVIFPRWRILLQMAPDFMMMSSGDI